jgi:hypothetical protein
MDRKKGYFIGESAATPLRATFEVALFLSRFRAVYEFAGKY